MRLFTALWPPADVAAALVADTRTMNVPAGWRLADPHTWHITLGFHGDADPTVLARRWERKAHGAAAPRLRLSGAGAFPGVRWVGVEADPAVRLAGLVEAAGGDPALFVAHLTVLRARRRPGPAIDPDLEMPWSAHRGPWWRPAEVLLVASEPMRAGSHYRVVHRAPLAPPRAGDN